MSDIDLSDDFITWDEMPDEWHEFIESHIDGIMDEFERENPEKPDPSHSFALLSKDYTQWVYGIEPDWRNGELCIQVYPTYYDCRYRFISLGDSDE